MAVSAVLGYAAVFLLLGVSGYYGWKLVKAATEVFAELFVMYRIMIGGSSYRDTKRPLRLYTYICDPQYLDEVTVNELYNFLIGPMISTTVGGKETISALHKVLLSYTHLIMYRDKIDGSLRGITAMGFEHKKKYTLLKIGLTFFKSSYQGGPYSYLIAAYLVLRELIFHPFTPIYCIGKVYGYKTYLIPMKFKESYPRYNKETPEYIENMLSEYAYSVMAEGDTYNEETNVLKQERTRLSNALLTVTEQDLQNPHIKFFVERNPDYTKGHCLVVVMRMTWRDVITGLFLQVLRRSSRNRTGNGSRSTPGGGRRKKPKLLRRYTFQEESANAYAVGMYEMDLNGEPIETDKFAFGPTSPTSSSPDSPTRLPEFKI